MRVAILAATVLIVSVGAARAGIRADLSGDAVVDFATTMDMPFMTVGNPGNADDTHGYGGVDCDYRMAKFEVTAGQYCEFLNAVAAADTYALYNTDMDTANYQYGCNIQRTVSAGSYTYSVAADWEDRPVNCISWGDAARFCNWLTNGMPTGAQDLTTTEDGSYFLNGATGNEELMTVRRKGPQDWGQYVIPTEDEWYKAAYHRNDGVTGNYFNFPTGTDTFPDNDLIDPDSGNNASFDYAGSIGSPYWRTEAGEHENSASPYGTFDMAGNVWEWNEAILSESERGMRGGSYGSSSVGMRAADRGDEAPAGGSSIIGFRVAEAPEPASAALMLGVGGFLVRRRRRNAP